MAKNNPEISKKNEAMLSNSPMRLGALVLLILIGACDNDEADGVGDDTGEATGGKFGASGGRKNGNGTGGSERGGGGKLNRGTGGEGMGGEVQPSSGGAVSTGGSSGGSGGGETSSGGSGGLGGATASGGAAGSGGEGSGGASSITNHTCTAEVAAGTTFVIPCPVAGPVRHVRIEGLVASSFHGSSQLLFGYSSAPESSQPETGEGQLRVLFYGGGPGGNPGPQVVVYTGGEESTLSSSADFVHERSTVCLDLYPGSETVPPEVLLWRDGENGADCGNWATLTLESAWAWSVSTGGDVASILGSQVLFRQPAGSAKLTVFDANALERSEG